MKIIFVIILTCFCITAVKADDERILMDAKINGEPVRLMIDTASIQSLCIYSKTAERLGIKYTILPSSPYKSASIGWTRPCFVDLGYFNLGMESASFANSSRVFILVMETPLNVMFPEDGVIGWGAMKTKNFSIDAVTDKISLNVQELLKSSKWKKFQLETNLGVLALDIPLGKGTNSILVLDTGSKYGVSLNSQKWSEWKIAHTNQPSTIEKYYGPSIGLVIREESWAHKLSLGSLSLTDVPVMEADSIDKALGFMQQKQYAATLGLAALKRLDIIIDGKNGFAFIRPKTTAALPYQHNRLGADFVPKDSQSDNLIAHVINGSPAYEAGIRDGDILLSVNKSDAAKQYEVFLSSFSVSESYSPSATAEYPAGTELEFTLKRGDKIFKTTATLRNIILPDAPKNSN